MTFKAGCLAAVAFAASVLAGGAQAGIVNGSFEADFQAAGTWSNYANLTGWTGGSGGIELRNNVAGAAYDGVNYVELDTYQNSMASQAVTTTGAHYTLSFAYSPRMNVPASSNGIEVWWNGSLLDTVTGIGNSTGNNWVLYTYDVLGTSPSSLLQFVAVGTSDSLGGSLDAVSLAQVPEPATLLLLGLGMVGVAVSRKRSQA